MLALSWAVASASNSQVIWINWCQITISYCLRWWLWFIQGMGQSSVYGSIFVLLLKYECYILIVKSKSQIVIGTRHSTEPGWCVVQPFLQGSGLSAVCGSAIFTRLKTFCCLWFSHFYKAQHCLLSMVQPFLQGSGLSAVCGSAIFIRLRTVCCLWFGHFYKAQDCLLSVVQPFLQGTRLSAVCG